MNYFLNAIFIIRTFISTATFQRASHNAEYGSNSAEYRTFKQWDEKTWIGTKSNQSYQIGGAKFSAKIRSSRPKTL
jgi:hypothetical protein